MSGDSERIRGKPEVTVRGRISPDKASVRGHVLLLHANVRNKTRINAEARTASLMNETETLSTNELDTIKS